ncbi:MAG: hypothetical protein DRO67_09400 [Candidatus Asgardarchaeum californiense]|nr:MAG: hypothetical protein DRO67_09400 [Candidatus Asgardarchaeum californiense]
MHSGKTFSIDMNIKRMQTAFKVLLLANLLFTVGDSMVWVYLAIYIYSFTESLLLVSTSWLLFEMIWMASQFIWGYIGDRIQRRSLILLSSVIGYTSSLAGVILLVNPYMKIASFAFSYLFVSGYYLNANAVGTLLKDYSHGEAIGFIASVYSMASFLGSILATLIIFLGFSIADTYVVAIVIVLSATFVLPKIIRLEKQITIPMRKGNVVRGGYKSLLRDIRVVVIIISTIMFCTSLSTLLTYFPIYYVEAVKGSLFLYGLSTSMISLLSLMLSPIFGKLADKDVKGYILTVGYSYTVLIAIALSLLTIHDPLILLIFVSIPAYVGYSIGQYTYFTNITTKENRSRMISLFHSSEELGYIFGYGILMVISLIIESQNLFEIVYFSVVVSIGIAVLSAMFAISLVRNYTTTKAEEQKEKMS